MLTDKHCGNQEWSTHRVPVKEGIQKLLPIQKAGRPFGLCEQTILYPPPNTYYELVNLQNPSLWKITHVVNLQNPSL